MIGDRLASQGSWFFRWRSYVLLGFAPLLLLTLGRPEPIEVHFGPMADVTWEAACMTMAFLGLSIRALTVGFVPAGTSGRTTRKQVARTLNTTGLYSLTRNPLYFGNAVIYVAVAAFTQDIYFVVLMCLFLVIYLERIIATEERFLSAKFGDTYRNWAREVPVFLPSLVGWKPPDLPFSIRNVLRREYSGFFAIIATLFTIDSAREYVTENAPIDRSWLIAFTLGAVIYVGLLTLKRRTTLLDVSGR